MTEFNIVNNEVDVNISEEVESHPSLWDHLTVDEIWNLLGSEIQEQNMPKEEVDV